MYTQGENIADNGGLRLAHAAYQSLVQQNGSEPTLPGLNQTANQLFWISAAQLWCAKTQTNNDTLYTPDVHSPEIYRVIGSVRNTDSFSRDFNCPSGSPMNPTNKCQVW